MLAGKAIDCESRLLADPQLSDVGLVDTDLELHFVQVSGDGEHDGRLETRGHHLPDIDRPVDNGAIDRGADAGVVEVELRLRQLRLGLLNLGLGGGERCFRRRDRGLVDAKGRLRQVEIGAGLESARR